VYARSQQLHSPLAIFCVNLDKVSVDSDKIHYLNTQESKGQHFFCSVKDKASKKVKLSVTKSFE